MSLQTEQLKIIDVLVNKIYCDKCGEEMQPYGIVYTTYPPQYPYICPKCNYKITLTERTYPIYYPE